MEILVALILRAGFWVIVVPATVIVVLQMVAPIVKWIGI